MEEKTTVYLPLVMNDWKVMEESMAYTLGIDVSRWQDNNSTAQQMDFTKSVAMGAKFVFIKSSQALWTDEDILYNWKSSKKAGLLRGAYHFLDWVANPKTQAQYAWSLIQNDPGELPPVVDFEYWQPPPANAFDILWNYVVEMERLSGKKPIIYTGAFFWNQHGTDADVWKNYPLWIASYTDQSYMEDNVKRLTPWDTFTFWQWSDKGDGLAFGAESLGLDMNWFNGTYKELLDFAGISQPIEPPPVIDPPVDPTDPPEDSAKIKFEVISDELNIRTDPKVSSTTYTGRKLKKGDIVVFDKSYAPYENWIFDKNINGWVAEKHAGKQYLKRIEE